MTQVSQVMTRGVRTLSPQDTVQFAAQAMDELGVGAVPVCDGRRLVGMVTDRDIAVRAVAQGLPNESTPLQQVMSADVQWCYEDQPVDEVAQRMEQARVRRMPVVDRERRLVGVVSLGDLAAKGARDPAADALEGISSPARPDRSGQSAASGPAGGGSASGQARRGPN